MVFKVLALAFIVSVAIILVERAIKCIQNRIRLTPDDKAEISDEMRTRHYCLKDTTDETLKKVETLKEELRRLYTIADELNQLKKEYKSVDYYTLKKTHANTINESNDIIEKTNHKAELLAHNKVVKRLFDALIEEAVSFSLTDEVNALKRYQLYYDTIYNEAVLRIARNEYLNFINKFERLKTEQLRLNLVDILTVELDELIGSIATDTGNSEDILNSITIIRDGLKQS